MFGFFKKLEKDANIFFLKNMLGKILGFGRMQQKIFFLFENVFNFLKFLFKIFWRN